MKAEAIYPSAAQRQGRPKWQDTFLHNKFYKLYELGKVMLNRSSLNLIAIRESS